MPANGNAWQRSLQAAESAGRLLDEVGVDQTRQIDVFSMCEDLDLWLAFLPMDGLLGAFVPEGTGGVLITDRRPITVQRYTAAHELGHWRLEHGHGLALDGEEHVFGTNPAERERLAQMFAANLLMPPPLVLSLLARIGIGDHGPVRPDQAYFVAREAGVSYEAAVRQLTNLQVITAADGHLVIGGSTSHGQKPSSPAVVDRSTATPTSGPSTNSGTTNLSHSERTTRLSFPCPKTAAPATGGCSTRRSSRSRRSPSRRLSATLRSPPTAPANSTGSSMQPESRHPAAPPAPRWTEHGAFMSKTPAPPRSECLHGGAAVVGDDYLPGRAPKLRPREARRARLAAASGETPASETNILMAEAAGTLDRPVASRDDVLIAATGRRLFGVRFVEPGPKTLRLQHRSPYSSEPPVEEYVLHAIVEPRRQRFSIDQLIEDPGEAWVGEVRERKIHEPTVHVDDPERD